MVLNEAPSQPEEELLSYSIPKVFMNSSFMSGMKSMSTHVKWDSRLTEDF